MCRTVLLLLGPAGASDLPLLFVGIPLAFAVYAPLTFFRLWIVQGEMGRRRRLVWALVAVEAAVTVLTIGGR